MLQTKKFYFATSISDEDGFIQKTIPPGAYELENLDNETERNIIEPGNLTAAKYPFKIQPSFSTLGSTREISSRITSSQVVFFPDDSIRDLLGFKPVLLHEEKNNHIILLMYYHLIIFSSKLI